jgi:hypothetical protein
MRPFFPAPSAPQKKAAPNGDGLRAIVLRVVFYYFEISSLLTCCAPSVPVTRIR